MCPSASRLATIIGTNDNKTFCSCGDASGPGSGGAMDCCHVVELGVVYEQEPDLSEVCEPCTRERLDGSTAISAHPHGKITDWRRACARLIVLTKADISSGALTYEDRFVYYSRQIGQLPGPDVCQTLPIICPSENGIYTCCPKIVNGTEIGGQRVNGICHSCGGVPDCSGEAKVLHNYSLTPCQLSTGGFMAGYAYAPSNWWFLTTPEFGEITYQIIENDPYNRVGSFLHTVYIYLQLESKYIYCCQWDQTDSYTPPSNSRSGPCGSSNFLGMRDDALRERSVRIYAALGFSGNTCGYTPESACLLAASASP